MPSSSFQMPVIDPFSPMNDYYCSQAEAHAKRNPHDPQAQAIWMHWVSSLQQIRAAQAGQATAQTGPLGGASPMPAQAGAQAQALSGTGATPQFGGQAQGAQERPSIY